MCLTCSMLPESYAQRAENLNLNRIVQPPYHCYGRLADGCPHAEELGWKVGVQFYTFHKYTFFEAIDLTRALGLHYIEATIGHGFARKVLKTSMPDSSPNGGNASSGSWLKAE